MKLFNTKPFLLFTFLLFWFISSLAGVALASNPEISISSQRTAPEAIDLKPITVQVNWNHQFEFAGFYAAIKQGYYREAGLDVTVKSWKPGIYGVDEVVNGKADFATGYTSIIADYARGAPISIVMTSFQFSPMVLISHEPVLSLEQLSGKKVMHYGNMQIKALIKKANAVISEPVKELASTGNLQDFIDKKTDLYAAYNTNEPFRLRKEGVPFFVLDPKTYGIQSYGDLVFTSQKMVKESPKLVSDFKKATIKGWQYAIENQEVMVDYIIENYPVVKDRDSLLLEASATKVYVQPGNSEVGGINSVKLLATGVDAVETGLLNQEELDSLDVDKLLFAGTERFLTDEELAYLEKNPVIKIGNDSYWEPFEFVDDKGNYKGIAADYMALIGDQLGVKFEHQKHRSWADVIQMAKNHDVSILSCAVATPERKRFMNFTTPYLSFPVVLVATDSTNFIDDFSQLNGKVVAVPKGYWSQEWIEQNYPQINLLLVDSVKDGLEAVLLGKAQAYSGNLASINFAIKRYGLNGLNVVGSSDARFELAIGVDKTDPVLLSIMQKALNNITLVQKDQIYNKWIQLQMLHAFDQKALINVIVFSVLIGLMLVSIIFLFHRQKQRQNFYITQVNELSLATYTRLPSTHIEWVSDSFLKMIGCKREEIIGRPHSVLKHPNVPDHEYEKILRQVKQGKSWHGEVLAQGCDGIDYWIDATVTPEFRSGKLTGFWTTRVDISDKKRLEKMAVIDTLTGVYNRNQFNEMFEMSVHKAARESTKFSMAMFDVDFFKMVNDRYGHQRGDEVLKEIVGLTKKYFSRANDVIFRVGGEEFVILCDFDNHEEFERYLNNFRTAVQDLNIPNPDSAEAVVTVSIGAIFCHQLQPMIKAPTIYSRVDKMLYSAKDNGRNRAVVDSSRDICEF